MSSGHTQAVAAVAFRAASAGKPAASRGGARAGAAVALRAASPAMQAAPRAGSAEVPR
jgi:hypothetical protein